MLVIGLVALYSYEFSYAVADRDYVLKKCPYLLNEMISIAAQHVALAHAGKGW